MDGYRGGTGPLALAHRGGAGLASESTRAAFGTALALGLTHLETDVRVTRDGVAVAFHDEHLDRVTDLRGPVASVPWDVLRRARVQVGGLPGGGVLRLDDLLGDHPHARFAVDLKTAAAVRPLLAALRRTGSAHRVCVAGAWDGWLAAVRDGAGPGLATALGWRSLSTLVACARAGVRPPAAVATGPFVHLPWRWGALPVLADPRLRARLVEQAADLGVEVVAWTVDDASRQRALLDDGVAGVITDRPDVLREVLVQRGEWSPMRGSSASVRSGERDHVERR